ncbi:hypothetical protein IMAU30132_00042 [Lactobacillus helveticus]|uniref:hypothetical protein n=1 Tax=Lactobacillus helveticus TaxID=1587 RepID=UPI001561DDBC|nr:hypothetical protein [Lactobacillus helveticus]NRO47692.1 hypothetical protein [Lactobacillus helveticus]
MGLAIDGNEVHGIARGGQAFVSLESANKDGSINIDGKNYYPFAENPSGRYKIAGTDANLNPIEINFTISEDGKLTVTKTSNAVYQGTTYLPINQIEVTKQPL